MLNVMMQLCGLLIIIFLFVLYKSHKTLNLPGEKVFTSFMVLSFICLLLDALSVVAIHYSDFIPGWLLNASCKSYLISLIWVGWINFSYICIDLISTPQKHRRTEIILAGVTLIESIIVCLLPIETYENGMAVYSSGPAVIADYICTLLYILSTLTAAVVISRKGSKRRGFAVIITTCIWILAAIIQAYKNEYLVVGFSEAIGVMILYVVMENPDKNLDKRFGCFNTNAFQEYLDTRFKTSDDFGMVSISFGDIQNFDENDVNEEAISQKLISKLLHHKDVLLFKNDFLNLAVLSDNRDLLDEITTESINFVSTSNYNLNEFTVYLFDNAKHFKTSTELLNFLTYIRGNYNNRKSTIVHVSDEMITEYRNIGVIKKEIDDALEEDRVEVFMQPIYSNNEKRIVSAEALVRIRNHDGSYLSPGIFIPVAESTGQVKILGERVLEKVCEFIKNNDVRKYGLHTIDVNLSAIQCDDNNMAGRICNIVDNYGVDSGLISFEITETAVSHAKDTLIDNMEALVSRGFKFALDDFGKGESNLIYIVEMPVKFIKLDIDMTKAFFSNQKAKHVLASISDMAQRLNLPIVAEGIETKDELDGICKEGIQLIQGYYYSRPLAMTDFIDFIANFKVCEAEAESYDNIIEEEITEETIQIDPCDFAGQKVLLVEDNELNREIAREILEDFDFIVDTAEDGTIAVEKMQNASAGDYDFILMDIRMPYMDGFEATRRIRGLKNKAVADIPIIALTAYASDDDTNKQAKQVGMDAITPKPINVTDIMEILMKIRKKKEVTSIG